jgi:calcium-dependent protein kinase
LVSWSTAQALLALRFPSQKRAYSHTNALASTFAPTEQPATTPKDLHASKSVNKKSSKAVHRGEWRVQPGYSSGASSCDDDEYSLDGSDSKDHHTTTTTCSNGNKLTLGSEDSIGVLDLRTLKQEMSREGDISKTVVRIETASPFGTPIEEIYVGVHDGAILGSGVSGTVRLVTHRATGVAYAVKCLDIGLISTLEGLKSMRNEIFIMCQLDHPNIVRIEEVYESTNEIYIVQELCEGGDLFDRLDEQANYHYTEAQCAQLVKYMLSAIRYLHSRGIIHRDLKLENFLFSGREVDSELKMIDFGLSKHFEIGQSHSEQVGTPYTVAPEIIQGSYDEKADIWSVGVIAYLLLSGETPFGGLDGENMVVVKENIIRAKVLFEPHDVWVNVSEDGKSFIKSILQGDPKKRPTAKEAQRSDWIKVWAKKDIKDEKQLNSRTLEGLIAFKEYSDLQKLLAEVLSFTLLPSQIADLRKEFELIDTDGRGEITLKALRKVLKENAEAGLLGALNEKEIEDIFDALKTRKSEPTIRWHEFLAAGLSQARVDERNLRLAFDRLDTYRRGYVF